MLHAPDIRFKAAVTETAQARRVVFPIRVRVNRPSGEHALGEARRVVEQFREAVEEAEIPGGKLSLFDFTTSRGKTAEELSIEQVSKREVRLQLVAAAVLSLAEPGDFWSQAAAIVRAADVLQAFSQQPREKDVEIDVQQARLLAEAGMV